MYLALLQMLIRYTVNNETNTCTVLEIEHYSGRWAQFGRGS